MVRSRCLAQGRSSRLDAHGQVMPFLWQPGDGQSRKTSTVISQWQAADGPRWPVQEISAPENQLQEETLEDWSSMILTGWENYLQEMSDLFNVMHIRADVEKMSICFCSISSEPKTDGTWLRPFSQVVYLVTGSKHLYFSSILCYFIHVLQYISWQIRQMDEPPNSRCGWYEWNHQGHYTTQGCTM